MNIEVAKRHIAFFQCFSSENKLYIIELLRESPRNIMELAKILGVSSAIITRHISALERAGIVKSELVPAKRGQQKICRIAKEQIVLDFSKSHIREENTMEMVLPIGKYSGFYVEPTCGLASTRKYIGIVDDPRYFSNPEASEAGMIWLESGYLEYTLPSYLFDYPDKISAITISMEICSEYPKFKNEHPSDIVFSLNGVKLGIWTSPGSFGDKKGLYTPSWFTCGTEYGLLKYLRIDEEGTYIDGLKISDVKIKGLDLSNKTNQVLRIASPKDVENPGGITLFGKGFGNHNQDINIIISYK